MADTTHSNESGFAAVDAAAEALAPKVDAAPKADAAPKVEAIGETASDTVADVADEAKDAVAPIKEGAFDLRAQASDKVLAFAQDGKARATGALDQLSQMLTDAAGTVDEKLGEQYGQYARTAAETVQSLSASIEDKSVDDLVADVRAFVGKSPAVAIGIATALGFVVARVASAGLDQRDQA